MAGKRKKATPLCLNKNKRKLLTWNMLEDNPCISHDSQSSSNTHCDNNVIDGPSNSIVVPHLGEKDAIANSSSDTDLDTNTNLSSNLYDIECPEFKRIVDDCGCYITVQKLLTSKTPTSCELGQFSISLLGDKHKLFHNALKQSLEDEFWIYIADTTEKHVTYFENRDFDKSKCIFFQVMSNMPVQCLQACNTRAVKVVLHQHDIESSTVAMKVYLLESGLTRLKFSSDYSKKKTETSSLLEWFYGFNFPVYKVEQGHVDNIDKLFDKIKTHHTQEESSLIDIDVQHPGLRPLLRPYQKSAVRWMLAREKYGLDTGSGEKKEDLHQLYKEFVSKDGTTLYYNTIDGNIVKDKPLSVPDPNGGILADEMGLGKTVEVLACVLLHTRNCSTVAADQNTIASDTVVHATEPTIENAIFSSNSVDILSPVSSSPVDSNKCHNTVSSCQSECHVSHMECNSIVPNIPEGVISLTRESDTAFQEYNSDNESCSTVGYPVDQHIGNVDIESDCDNIKNHVLKGFKPKVEQKQYFECICGADKDGVSLNMYTVPLTQIKRKRREKEQEEIAADKLIQIQCVDCGVWQHAACLKYDTKDPRRGVYKCPYCHIAGDPIPSGATLIVTPSSISHQWVEEINKHINKQHLKVMVYEGVSRNSYIQPQTLANQDLVITTYETLRKEIDFVDLPHVNSGEGRKLRHAKRWLAVPSPIITVQWWRICLDEAQMVECVSTKTANMALRLSAINRWCVTGTPIQRSFKDLYGLILFLGYAPYWVENWWNRCLYVPYCSGVPDHLHSAMSRIMWRMSKDDVLDQINLPEQEEEIHWLTFNPIEEHFYRRQYEHCALEARKNLSKWADKDATLSSLDRATVVKLMLPLLKLRQACIHPQVVKGEFLPIHKSTMTMEKLLESLIQKTKIECEEAHRLIVSSCNGLAAMHIIQGQHKEAVSKYREVLLSVSKHHDRFRTDELQQLHTLHNLHELLSQNIAGVDPTLRDDQLTSMASDIREKYIAKAASAVGSAQETLVSCQQQIRKLENEFKDGYEWWIDILQYCIVYTYDEAIIDRIKGELLDNTQKDINSFAYRFRDIRGLQYIISSELDKLQQSHGTLKTAILNLGVPHSEELINQTVSCCLRPVGDPMNNCEFCRTHALFEEYESRLFMFSDRGEEHNPLFSGAQRQGTWADSEMERILKQILHFSKNKKGLEEMTQFGEIHIKLYEALKKEFKLLRSVWMTLREQVSAYDELNMATTRFRVRYPDEVIPEGIVYIIEPADVERQKLRLLTDHVAGQHDLARKMGQLVYLSNLAKSQLSIQSGHNPEPCAICLRELGHEWSVMKCCHCFCLSCIQELIKRYSVGGLRRNVRCALCREVTHQTEISFVTTEASQNNMDTMTDSIPVKGSYSTKITSVINCLKKIERTCPGAKTLVFSTWQEVLDLIGRALDENNITYRSLHAHHKFQENLACFKAEEAIQALLLPVHSGSNGLNLIEATHVILVEPILNPSQELQAIGRVHRIGQTRKTVVHRFIVQHTIESRIHNMLQAILQHHNPTLTKDENPITLKELTSLFSEEQ